MSRYRLRAFLGRFCSNAAWPAQDKHKAGEAADDKADIEAPEIEVDQRRLLPGIQYKTPHHSRTPKINISFTAQTAIIEWRGPRESLAPR